MLRLKIIGQFILPTLLLIACGASVKVDPNMQSFMNEITNSKSMMDAVEKHAMNTNMETDLDLYELTDPTVSAVSEKNGEKCYMMNVKHGILDSNCEICWKDGKVQSVTYVDS